MVLLIYIYNFSRIVIPANAGISGNNVSMRIYEIPAFAGKTFKYIKLTIQLALYLVLVPIFF
jgi:hypothetical protein